jgi:hypothetical protein
MPSGIVEEFLIYKKIICSRFSLKKLRASSAKMTLTEKLLKYGFLRTHTPKKREHCMTMMRRR